MKTTNCEQRIDATMKDRMKDLKRLLEGERDDDLGSLESYGLSFDYVAPGTFDDQEESYFRYQISWGGPSDEFRFFVNPDLTCHRIEYWLMDWFDGASRICTDHDNAVLQRLWFWFRDCGLCEPALRSGT